MAHRGTGGQEGGRGGEEQQGQHDERDVEPVDVRAEGVEQVLGHLQVGRQRGAEQPGLQERADVVGGEGVVRDRRVLGEVEAGPVEAVQHVQQREEHRCLHERGQERPPGADAVAALEFAGLRRERGGVAAMAAAQVGQLGGDGAGGARRAQLGQERFDHERAQGEHQEGDRERPSDAALGAEQEGEQLVPQPHDGGYGVVQGIEHGLLRR
jgi:hypothetical protein